MNKCPDELLSFVFVQNKGISQSYGTPGNIVPRERLNQITTGINIGKYVFGCCGAYEISSMCSCIVGDYYNRDKFTDEQLNRARQDWLTVMARRNGLGPTYYFIVTDQQQNLDFGYMAGHKNSVFALLKEMGATCVDKTPNQVHGPAEMQLHVWVPNLNKDKLKQYIAIGKNKINFIGDYGGLGQIRGSFGVDQVFNPLWWEELSEKEQLELMEKYPVETPEQLVKRLDKEQSEALQRDIEVRKNKLTYEIQAHPEWLAELGWIRKPHNNGPKKERQYNTNQFINTNKAKQ